MKKKQICGQIIVTEANIMPVVQQHEEALPVIRERLGEICKRVDILYKMNWIIILLLVAVFGEKALSYAVRVM